MQRYSNFPADKNHKIVMWKNHLFQLKEKRVTAEICRLISFYGGWVVEGIPGLRGSGICGVNSPGELTCLYSQLTRRDNVPAASTRLRSQYACGLPFRCL